MEIESKTLCAGRGFHTQILDPLGQAKVACRAGQTHWRASALLILLLYPNFGRLERKWFEMLHGWDEWSIRGDEWLSRRAMAFKEPDHGAS